MKTIFKFLKPLLFISAFLLSARISKAQWYNFKKYSTKNGLANSNVKQVLQTKNGYLWMATQGGGLSRFDGKNFKNYSKKDGLISNDLSCIEEDDDGNLWIGTTVGLCIFDGVKFNRLDKKLNPGKTTIYQIYKDDKGTMWITTDEKGLFIYKKNNETIVVDTSNGLRKNRVLSAIQEGENSYLIGTHKGGIYRLNSKGKILAKFDSIPNTPNASALCFYKIGNNEIYMGTNTSGLYKIKNDKFYRVEINGMENELIGGITKDKLNNIWVATEHGLLKITNNGVKIFNESDGLSSDIINSLSIDYENNLWVATQSGGVCMLKNDAVVTYTNKDGLNNNKINYIKSFSDGAVLTCTQLGGLFFKENSVSKFRQLNLSADLNNSNINIINQLNNGNIICGTNNSGLFIIGRVKNDFKIIKHIKEADKQLLNATISGICPDNKGNFWVGTFGAGLFYFDENGNLLESYSAGKGLSINELLSIHLNENGKLYIGEFKNQVVVKDGNSFKRLTDKLPEDLAISWSISSDKKGAIFFGTQDGGLFIYYNGKFIQYSTTNGLCSNFIQSVFVNDNGIVWIGTDKGVNRLVLGENYELKQIRQYTTEDGLLSAEVQQNGIKKDEKGFVWICTTNGLTSLDEANDKPILTPPKLILADIRLHYEHVNWADYTQKINLQLNIPTDLNLPYDQNHLTFDFRALTTDHVKYKFILENLDDEWSPLTLDNQAVYSNIPPGKYKFRVKATNSFGIESKDEIIFDFTIDPPFWKTWWFYLICGLIISSGLFFFFKWRTAKLEREKKVLEKRVTERTMALKEANENLSVALHDIKDSINYAERIQRAMLPVEEKIHQYLPNSFILFRPRDVVSGDFYWFSHKDGIDYVAAVDCTGHGVPGAFMSLVGSSLLNEIVLTKGILEPSSILSQLNIGVQNSLKQRENNTRDGMDIALCAIDYEKKKLTYAGANRSLWIIRKEVGNVEEVKATKSAIGGFTDEDENFKEHEIVLQNGDSIYLHSDGFADQFGGSEGKKLMTKRFKEILKSVFSLPMEQQGKKLNEEIVSWMGTQHEQVDDMLVIGIRF